MPFGDFGLSMDFLNPRPRQNNFLSQDTFGGGFDFNRDYQAPDESSDFYERYRRLYDPANMPALQRYKDYLEQMPEQADYMPGKMTRLAAGLVGLSSGMRDAGKGVQDAYNLNTSQYRNALQDYSSHAGLLKEGAGLERQAIDDQGQLLNAEEQMRYKYADLNRQTTRDQRTYDLNRADLLRKYDRDRWEEEVGRGRLNNDTINTNSLVGYRRGQLGLGEYNAVTGRMNAGSNAQQAAAAAANAQTNRLGLWHRGSNDALANERADARLRLDERRLQHDMMKPTADASDVSTAEQDELASFSQQFPKWVVQDRQGNYILKPPDNPAELAMFNDERRALQGRIQQRLSGGISYGGPEADGQYTDSGDDEWEQLP